MGCTEARQQGASGAFLLGTSRLCPTQPEIEAPGNPLTFDPSFLQEAGEPASDELRGLRVHCWVLVLSGSRDVEENFFIDPLSGNSYATKDGGFLGIESVWDNYNYYVNMQDCSSDCSVSPPHLPTAWSAPWSLPVCLCVCVCAGRRV